MFKFRKGGYLPRPPLHFNKIIFQIRLDIATECLKRLSFHDIFIISRHQLHWEVEQQMILENKQPKGGFQKRDLNPIMTFN